MSSTPLTVTELTARIKQVLEQGFAQVEVTGEISRLTTPSSGHLYFTIKDAHAAISAVVWRTTATRLQSRPKEGQAYVFIGHLSLYEPRGTYQLVIKRIEAVGAGRLAAEYERRKQVFAERGWFAQEHKQLIPKLPKHIGLVTSATAAAFEDVKKVLATRPHWLNITLSPSLVQGELAPKNIVSALHRLHHLPHKPDVILLVRGGGSIEDLWCFNDESVVQAVFESTIPIISGIGHEIDTTLVDFAADIRAATPSNAAELACPARSTLRQQIPNLRSMSNLLNRRLHTAHQQVAHLTQQLEQSKNRLQDQHNWVLERLLSKNQEAFRQGLRTQQNRLKVINQKLHQLEPNQQLRQNTLGLFKLKQHLITISSNITTSKRNTQDTHALTLFNRYKTILQTKKEHWQRFHEQLHAMNPDHVLQRGYAMTTNAQGKVISSVHGLKLDTNITLHYHDGSAESLITKVQKVKSS
ncbi:MAG: exodeoxyribonuclease VII large subunit [Ghiorsea sp.]